ncbi:MAG: PQQ-dependent sugar dehydrogenase [Gemmatimonadota bacterium]|nr:PQQ-dependent sugar dehydrogenase [Gemmatimonadota bacterium]
MQHDRHSGLPLAMLVALLASVVACAESSAPDNRPPAITITAPGAGASIAESTVVLLRSSATDPEDGVLGGSAVDWTSSLDGPLGTGGSLTVPTLSAGNHSLSATATDSRGVTATATVTITVVPFTPGNNPPTVAITSPTPGASITTGTAVVLQGIADDPEDGSLTGSALTWSSSLDGSLGTGTSLTVDSLSAGSHTITLQAADLGGVTNQATLLLIVTSPTPNIGLTPVISGMSSPVLLTAPPGDLTRLFIVEQSGAIRIIKNGTLLSTAFLTLSDSISTGSEQGLLGLAFAPDYASSGRFYVSYTNKHGPLAAGTSLIERYTVSGNADIANAASGQRLLTLDDPYDNHNGGMIAFGPDGYLYYGMGDGGGGGDPLNSGQDRTDLFASMLRLDVSGSGPYTIPASNPYATHPSFRHELWNHGLRNPWRWSFDRQTGDLYIGDVGQGAHEEIDVQLASSGGGENYGWRSMEGFSCYGASSCNQTGLTLPKLDYDHSQGCAVTGGYVYRGSATSLRGRYLYADYCGGWVRSFRFAGGAATDQRDEPALAPGGNITSFGEDAAGEVYVLTQGGSVYRITGN